MGYYFVDQNHTSGVIHGDGTLDYSGTLPIEEYLNERDATRMSEDELAELVLFELSRDMDVVEVGRVDGSRCSQA